MQGIAGQRQRAVNALGETYVEVVADDHHGRVTAGALALDLDDGELAVLGRLARLDAAQLGADGVEDLVRAAEHARRRRAHLDEVLTDGFTACTRTSRGQRCVRGCERKVKRMCVRTG